MDHKNIITVGGKPFFPLGGQVCNSSAYSVEELRYGLDALALIRANTAEIPIYWDQVEPEEGHFSFSHVGDIIDECGKRGLKIIFLWFGTWKNANMKYAPAWVKRNRQRFWTNLSADGLSYPSLSPACRATRDADSRAFCALMAYIRNYDKSHTVIMMQVENEPGVLHSLKRDYGEASQALFDAPVPQGLVEAVKQADGRYVKKAWDACGSREGAAWKDTFGLDADELFNAWQIAAYINSIAEDGKKVYDLPMYTNFWIGDNDRSIAGYRYPSGSAVGKTLEVWHWAAPALCFFAPDNYMHSHDEFSRFCEVYSKGGHPLFIPESGPQEAFACNIFTAIAEYNVRGYAVFGVEGVMWEDGTPNPEAAALIGSYHALSAFAPVLPDYLGTGRIRAVNQKEYMGWRTLEFEDWIVSLQYGSGGLRTDYHHRARPDAVEQMSKERGRGLVIEAEPNVFYALGAGFNLIFWNKKTYRAINMPTPATELLDPRAAVYLSVEEGFFNTDGQWVTRRIRNGDESDTGVWVSSDIGVVRIELV